MSFEENQGRVKKKRPLHGETEAWAEGDTVATGTLTAWQKWTFPVTPCWLLGLDTTIWIILVLAPTAWCDASWGERVSKFTGLHKACGIRNPMLRCFHAEMLPYNHHKVSDSIMLPRLCVCTHPPEANKKAQQPVDPRISMRFLRNSRLWLEVITCVQKKKRPTRGLG